MKNIRFIDCGANIGQSIDWAKKIFSNNNLKVDSFEPLPLNIQTLKNKYSNEKNITIHDCAVSTADGMATFYCQHWGARTGSSLTKKEMTGAPTGKKELKDLITVKTIDLARWLKLNIMPNEIPVLKIDIEGSEYDVLPHLFENKIHHMIDYWLIEFHSTKKSPNYNGQVIDDTKKNVKVFANWAIDHSDAENALGELL